MQSLLELREAAKALPFENPNRLKLLQVSDELWSAVVNLQRNVTAANLTMLNGVWARARVVFDQATKPPTPPLAGAPEVDDLSDLLDERMAA